MRTTVRLDDQLLREAKRAAAEAGQTLTALIEDSLRKRLARRQPGRPSKRRLPRFRGTGLQPGVDLDDTSALLDLMDARDPLRR
jgi:hypothetical protein